MNVMRNIRSSSREWIAFNRAADFQKPPYSKDFKVTPLSVFGDSVWEFPVDWMPAGRRNYRFVNWLSESQLMGFDRPRLFVNGGALLEQAKEVVAAHIFHRQAFILENEESLLTPSTINTIGFEVRRLFTAFKVLGCSSLNDVTQEILDRAFSIMELNGGPLAVMVHRFDQVRRLSRQGFVVDGLPERKFKIVVPRGAEDTSKPKGVQPLSEQEFQDHIGSCLPYIDRIDFIIENLGLLRDGSRKEKNLALEALSTLPCGRLQSHVDASMRRFVQASSASLIGHAVGLRPSEVLSTRRGFITFENGDAMFETQMVTLSTETTKAIQQSGGVMRTFRVDPYLAEVGFALDKIHKFFGMTGEYLFSGAGKGEEYPTNELNHIFESFQRAHNLEFKVTGYTGRKTLVATGSRVLTGGLAKAQSVLGHKSAETTAGYARANPFVREELYHACLDIVKARSRTLLESASSFGGPGLGGKQGIEIEKRTAKLLATDITGRDMEQVMEEFVEEQLIRDVVPVPVMPGVFCMKGVADRGACSKTSGDRLPDKGRCSPDCSFQVQTAYRRDLVLWEIIRLPEKMASNSLTRMQKDYWLTQLRSQLQAWPDLSAEFASAMMEIEELGK